LHHLDIIANSSKDNTLTSQFISKIEDYDVTKYNDLVNGIKKNTTITELDLSNNNIGVEGAKALAKALEKNKTITTLDLSRNNIGDDGFIVLGRACAGKKNITVVFGNNGDYHLFKLAQGTFEREKFYLAWNKIGDAGAIALAEALKVNNTITELNLRNNKIGDAGAIALGRACAGKNIKVEFGNAQKNNLFKKAQKYGNKKAESSYFFNIPAFTTGMLGLSTFITLATIITLSILASQGIIGFDSAAFIAPVASVGAINLVTFIGFAITEVTSKIMDYKNIDIYNKVHGLAKKQTLLQVLNPCHKVQFVDKELSKKTNNKETPLIEK
jgi:hypothetical protein